MDEQTKCTFGHSYIYMHENNHYRLNSPHSTKKTELTFLKLILTARR